MKNFNEFYQSASDELDKSIHEIITEEFITGERLNSTELVGKILSANQQITLDTLRIYHEWLVKELP